MKYGRNTLLYLVVMLCFHAIDNRFKGLPEQTSLYLLIIVACCDALYALLMQWRAVAGGVKRLYHILACWMPVYCVPLFFMIVLSDLFPHFSFRAMLPILYAANLASAVHNFDAAKRGEVIPIIAMIFALGLMMLWVIAALYRVHPGCLM